MTSHALRRVLPFLLIAWACGPERDDPIESSQDELLAGEVISTAVDGEGFLSCTGGRVATGWNRSGQQLLCSSGVVFYRNVDVKLQWWPETRMNAYACPEQWAAVGVKFEQDFWGNAQVRFRCARLGRNSETGRQTLRNGALACAANEQMSGFRLATNTVLCARRRQTCFGAAGDQCANFYDAATHSWTVNGGSLAHDACCFRNPSGKGCEHGLLDELGHDGKCVDSWQRAIDLTLAGRSWRRVLDPSLLNLTGTVVMSQYCAPTGRFVDGSDSDRCCSGQSHLWNGSSPSAATAQAQGFNLQGNVILTSPWVQNEPSTNMTFVCD